MDGLVTLFGGGGFLGRYVAQELLRTGVRVRIAQRDPSGAHFLRPLAALGQIQFVAADVAHAASVARALDGATAAVNLVGLLAGDLQRAHVDGARTVAEGAASAGVGALVHVSAIGADADAQSAYARTKGLGEQAVRAAFPDATILRPSVLFGAEDAFVNRFASMIALLPFVPVVRAGVRLQPAWVADAARAVAQAALAPDRFGGRTLALGGPEVMTMAELNQMIARLIGARERLPAVPDAVAAALARAFGWLPGAPITWDQWLMLQRDNVVGADEDGFAAFGIAPRPLAAVAPEWLVRYHPEGRFGVSRAALG